MGQPAALAFKAETMINFFRKIRKKLADDNPTSAKASAGMKTGKYLSYAIGEIVLVVVGILIALSINNWNEEQKERVKEREVLEDIMNNLNRNNELIRNSLVSINKMDKSSDIVMSVIRNKKQYSDTLDSHFFESTRSGGLLFPLSTEGYESLKNVGFDIIRSRALKDKILEIFEISYKTIKQRTQFANAKSVESSNYISTLFRSELRDRFIPMNYDQLLNNARYYSFLVDLKENQRAFYISTVLDCLSESEELIQLIKKELKNQ